MSMLLKHCDILAADGDGYRWLKNAYLGIEGSVIDYLGQERPEKAYDEEKDLSGRLGRKVTISHHGKKGKVQLEYYSSEDLEVLLTLLDQQHGEGANHYG